MAITFRRPTDVVDLPTDRPRPRERSYRGARLIASTRPGTFAIGANAATKLGCTPYAVLFTAYQTLIHRLSGADEFAVGIPTAGQALEGEPALVGHCVHFLPIRGNGRRIVRGSRRRPPMRLLSTPSTISDSLMLGSFVCSHFRAKPIAAALAITFNLDPDVKGLNFAGLTCSSPRTRSILSISICIGTWSSKATNYLVECEYATDLFDQPTIERWLDAVRTLLTAAIDDSSQSH